jgi:hypothetical protein
LWQRHLITKVPFNTVYFVQIIWDEINLKLICDEVAANCNLPYFVVLEESYKMMREILGGRERKSFKMRLLVLFFYIDFLTLRTNAIYRLV